MLHDGTVKALKNMRITEFKTIVEKSNLAMIQIIWSGALSTTGIAPIGTGGEN